MLEGEKKKLLDEMHTLKYTLTNTTQDHEAHYQQMISKYETALTQLQEQGQVEIQQANRSVTQNITTTNIHCVHACSVWCMYCTCNWKCYFFFFEKGILRNLLSSMYRCMCTCSWKLI